MKFTKIIILVLLCNISFGQANDSVIDQLSDEVFTIVEQPAEPVGGMVNFYQFVASNMRYPLEARQSMAQGKVYIQFIVDIDGSLIEITPVKGIGFGCDEEAVRVVKSSPKWNPAKQRGKKVKQRIILPITFKLSLNKSNSIGDLLNDNIVSDAVFPGGRIAFNKYIIENKRQIEESPLPNQSRNTITVSFVVDSVGSISDVSILNSLGPNFDNEAIRLVTEMPNWKPREVNGKRVQTTVKEQISFNNISDQQYNLGEKYYSNAFKLFKKNKLDKSLEEFNKAIQLNPTRLEYFLNRSLAFIVMERLEEGCADLLRIIERSEQAKSIYEANCNN